MKESGDWGMKIFFKSSSSFYKKSTQSCKTGKASLISVILSHFFKTGL
ncbi:hypothetical protein BCO26_0038 [Heyndrickxia coagulans 2-6]|nr:hypothetical protein BCO26_0038 [Heyndrickxia coagulans 2-6]